MASRPETIEKVRKARELQKRGLSIEEIAANVNLSRARVRELIEGVNWNSKLGKKTPIR